MTDIFFPTEWTVNQIKQWLHQHEAAILVSLQYTNTLGIHTRFSVLIPYYDDSTKTADHTRTHLDQVAP